MILRELLPDARITILESNSRNLDLARTFLNADVEYRNERYLPGETCNCDLTVIPLCFAGDREAIYRNPPSRMVLIHDWLWHRRGVGAVVSVALLKRMNLAHRDRR